jgi:type IX secretion system PorP/SprF family membrane protein
MRSTLIVILLLIAAVTKTVAQQTDPQFTNYIFNGLFINPATAGIDNQTQVSAIYRHQYLGYVGTFDPGGAPVTQILSASIPMKALGGGLGIYLVNDQIGGGNTNREVQLSYAYQMTFGNNRLAIGISGGLHNKVADSENYRPRDLDDPAIPTGTVSQIQPDFGAGIYLYNPGFTLGLSTKHITQPTFGLETPSATNRLGRNYYLTGSLLIGVSYTVDITPMFVVKSDLTTVSPEAGALVTYVNKYWGGVNYRWDDAVSFLAGGTFLNNSLRVGYAFDYVYSGIEAKAPTSHELFVSYALPAPRAGKKSIIRTPRYRF